MTCVDKAVFLYVLVFIAICEAQERNNDYQVPTPKVEALYPKGFRVTLKDDGYTFFGFRGNINKEFKGLSEGDIKHDIVAPKGGYWVYKNRDAELQVGDTIFYWIYVLKNGKGYKNTDLEYTVSEFVKEDGTQVGGQASQFPPGPLTPKNTSTPAPYDVTDNRYNTIAPDCTVSKTVVQGYSNICKDQLIFDEDFDQTSFRELKKWDAVIQFPTEPDYPFNVYIPDNTVSFEEGSFVITPVLTESQHREGFLHESLDLDARMMLKLPRFCSASKMFAQSRTDGFHAVVRKKVASLVSRIRGGSNSILRVVAEDPRAYVLRHLMRNHYPHEMPRKCTGKADTLECRQVASGAQILPPVTTAKITTRRSFNFMFGRVEVRAKLPSGSWIMPEINLEPSDNVYGPHNYESGLMRIAFVRGNPGLAKKLYGGPVLTNSEPFRSFLLQEKIGIDNWHKDYHNYTMIWRPDGIDLLVDGEQYGTVNPGGGFSEVAKNNNVGHASLWQRGTVMAPLDQMFHLTLGLRVGGINDFADDLEGKPWRNTASKAMLDFWKNKDSWHPSWYNGDLRVDYVRVYAL